ncbi:MAG: septation protein A [Salaquimonas sp.]
MSDAITKEHKQISSGLKLALEMGPLGVFLAANSYRDALVEAVPLLGIFGDPKFAAIFLFMIAMIISVAITWVLEKRLAIMPVVTCVMVLVFGAVSIWLQDEYFLKIKPTIVNVLFGVGLLIGLFVFKVPFMKIAFDGPFKLDDAGWWKLTFRWALYFLFLAVVNEIVWRNFSYDFWVGFKFWATMPMTMIFMLFQYPVLVKHALEPMGSEETKS